MTDAKKNDAGSEEQSEDLSLGERGAVGGLGRAGGRLALLPQHRHV